VLTPEGDAILRSALPSCASFCTTFRSSRASASARKCCRCALNRRLVERVGQRVTVQLEHGAYVLGALSESRRRYDAVMERDRVEDGKPLRGDENGQASAHISIDPDAPNRIALI
jgi:ppGpp synthetase/RelA/SpoT-type nucleotidyltranferase